MTSINSSSPKLNLRIQPITIEGAATAPPAGVYFHREHMDFVGFITDAALVTKAILWYGALTKGDAEAGTWSVLEWGGAAKTTVVSAAGAGVGEDPLHFLVFPYLRPILGDIQEETPTTITGIFRDFSS